MSDGPWREPAEESIDLYPGLVVCDNRVTGSITTGRSRLPLWAFAGVAIEHGWAEVESGWSPSEYGWDAEKLGEFIYFLLENRGELARLLCLMANAERVEYERSEEALAPHGPVVRVKVFDTDPDDAVELPPPWWAVPELRTPVLEQLKRCVAVLEDAATPSAIGGYRHEL